MSARGDEQNKYYRLANFKVRLLILFSFCFSFFCCLRSRRVEIVVTQISTQLIYRAYWAANGVEMGVGLEVGVRSFSNTTF